MKKRNKKAITIVTVLLSVTIAFIWLHSCMGMEESSEESGFFYDLLCPFFELFMGKGNVTEHFIRKLAHFTEFFGLGTEFMLFMSLVLLESKIIIRIVNAWTIGTICALIDETIQIFSGRGPAIQDVWLDSAGCFTGIIIMLIGIMIWERKKEKTHVRF